MRRIILLLSVIIGFSASAKAQCDANFTTTLNGAQASFAASTTSQNIWHYWLFGDGGQGFGANVSHTYGAPGVYNVLHMTTDSVNNCHDSVWYVINVNFTTTCAVTYTSRQDSLQPNKYYFTAQPTISGSTVQNYLWSINGNNVYSSNQPNFSYTFAQAGTYIICVRLQTVSGCVAESCDSLTVQQWVNCTWQASFTASTPNPAQPRTKSFQASPVLAGTSYHWKFGDGQQGYYGASTTHTYAQSGTYNVRLLMMDTLNNCYDSVVQSVVVSGLPADSCTASFTYTVDPTFPNQLTFTAISNQTITSQVWNFIAIDSSSYYTTNVSNPTYAFPDSGAYVVCVTITTSTGCVRTYCQTLTITGRMNTSGGRISSYPNPAQTDVRFYLDLEAQQKVKISIYNLSGTKVYSTERTGSEGMNSFTLPVQNLQRGQYVIDIHYGNERKRSIFQKL
jgi:PKD repeat protein